MKELQGSLKKLTYEIISKLQQSIGRLNETFINTANYTYANFQGKLKRLFRNMNTNTKNIRLNILITIDTRFKILNFFTLEDLKYYYLFLDMIYV